MTVTRGTKALAVAATAAALMLSTQTGASAMLPPPGIDGGKFALNCPYTGTAQIDPIVAPGAPVSAHLHDFFGNKTVDENSTPGSLLGGSTTCKLSADAAAYWVPAAYRSDTGVQVVPKKMYPYYFGTKGVRETRFPAGLEMLAGNPHATSAAEAGDIAFSCGEGQRTHTPVRARPYDCRTLPRSARSKGVVATVKFGVCWDGAGVAPADVTVPDANGECAGARLTQLQIRVHYGTGVNGPNFNRGDLLTFSSGPWWTFHGDFMSGWAQSKLDSLVDGCPNYPNRNCGFLNDADPGP